MDSESPVSVKEILIRFLEKIATALVGLDYAVR